MAPDPGSRCRGGLGGSRPAPGAAVGGEIELWQLAVGGGEGWGAGDRRHWRVSVPPEGRLLPDVTVGLYRAFLLDRRSGSQDPPPQRVAAPRTELVLPVELPRLYRLQLEVRDHGGRLVQRARIGRSRTLWTATRASWARPRKRRPGRWNELADSALTTSGGAGGSFGVRVLADATGFDLGLVRESPARGPIDTWLSIVPADSTRVIVELDGLDPCTEVAGFAAPIPLRFVGACMPRAWIEEAVLLPDGRLARDAGAQIRIQCRAIPLGPDSPPQPWLDAPIEVEASLEGYGALTFTATLAEGRPRARALVPLGSD